MKTKISPKLKLNKNQDIPKIYLNKIEEINYRNKLNKNENKNFLNIKLDKNEDEDEDLKSNSSGSCSSSSMEDEDNMEFTYKVCILKSDSSKNTKKVKKMQIFIKVL